MNRIIFALFLCATALVSYSKCAPQQSSTETRKFQRGQGEDVRELIKKEGITCENVKEFCIRGRDLENKSDHLVVKICEAFIEPLVCKKQQL